MELCGGLSRLQCEWGISNREFSHIGSGSWFEPSSSEVGRECVTHYTTDLQHSLGFIHPGPEIWPSNGINTCINYN